MALRYICCSLETNMARTTLFLFGVLIALMSSCISTKRLAYLQVSEGPTTDTLVGLRPSLPPYRLQVNDLLSIRVKALDQETIGFFNPTSNEVLNATEEGDLYFNGFVVNSHGAIRVPILGEIPVLGKTLEQVRIDLEERLLADVFKAESNLFVTVKMPGIRYTVTGEVSGPGSQIIYRDQVSMIEAIAQAGDIPITGDKTDVVLIRQYPLGQQVHHIDLTQISAMDSPYYYIQPNDMIIVNPLPQKTWGFGTTGIQSFTTLLGVLTALTTGLLIFSR